jgi:uncharacterized protein YjiS (DUF1127 family)
MLLSFVLSSINRWLRYHEAVRRLFGLTDRELRDLGISRSDISAMAWRSR